MKRASAILIGALAMYMAIASNGLAGSLKKHYEQKAIAEYVQNRTNEASFEVKFLIHLIPEMRLGNC